MRCYRVISAVLVASALAAGDEEAAAGLRASVERILAARGLTAEKAWALDLSGFKEGELKRIPDAVPDASDALRAALGQVCRTALLRRGPCGRLENARDICFLLASPDASDWRRAFRLLRREPLGDNLDKAALALAKDERPEVDPDFPHPPDDPRILFRDRLYPE